MSERLSARLDDRLRNRLDAWLGAWLVGGLLLEAGRDVKRGKPTEWGGMSYVRRPKAE